MEDLQINQEKFLWFHNDISVKFCLKRHIKPVTWKLWVCVEFWESWEEILI